MASAQCNCRSLALSSSIIWLVADRSSQTVAAEEELTRPSKSILTRQQLTEHDLWISAMMLTTEVTGVRLST